MGSRSLEQVNVSSMREDEEAFAQILRLHSSLSLNNVLITAVQLGLFDIIDKAGPGANVSASEIASQLPTQNPDAASIIDRMLRVIASHSILSCSLQDGGSVERLFGLKDLVLEGGDIFEKVHGLPFYEYLSKDPATSRAFDNFMEDMSRTTISNVLDAYKGFEGLTSLVDVGGGNGACLNMIMSKYPSIKGINFDMPHVIQNAPPHPGLKHIGGDMFSSIPSADAIIMKNILHNWDDEHCLKLLKNCYNALPENGKVIVVSWIISEVPDSSIIDKFISHMDIVMLMLFGGKQRTKKEFEALCKGAGFSGFRLNCEASCSERIMEFLK